MVESGKSFIKNVRREGRGWIYNNLEAEEQAVKQQRAEQLADTTTVNELWNTDTQATDWNTSVVWKVAEKIVNSKVWQALIWVAETIPEKLNKFIEPAKEQAAENKQAKEDLLKTQIYEDTAKIEKVAGIREDGTQVAPSQARKVAWLMEQFDKSKLVSSVFKDTFPSFWETSDWQRVFRTDWQYIVDRPVGYTTDLLWTMQDAYNSVTYAYAQNWVVFTPDDLKKAYPEYANVSDWTLANFISWCLYDVQRWQRSDIKTIWDAMGEMSMAEWYTNRLDGYLDILSDESFMQFWWQRRFDKNKEWEVDMLNAWMFLKDIANQIRETGEFIEWFSNWAILNNYRHMKSDDEETQELINMIDQYMTLLEEKEAHEWITAFTATLYKNYLTNIEWAKVDLSDEDIEFWDALRIRVQEKTSQARDKFWKIIEELRTQSEDESRYPMKNFLEYTMLWRYVMDNKWNYYLTSPWTRQQELVYSRWEDWIYIDAKTWTKYTEEQVRSMTAWGISNWIVNWLTSIADKWAEALIDAERIGASYKMWWLWKTTQYDLAMAFDALWAYWWLVQSIDPYLQLSTNAPVIWEPVEAWINAIISWWGELLVDMLVEMWIADWRTTESRDKAEEWLWVLFLMWFMKTVHLWKDMIIKSPKFKAYRKATDSFIKKISKSLKVFNKKWVERMIEQRNLELENEKLRREENIIKNQQKQNTTLEEDVRVKEKMSEKMTKETEQKKEEATKELVDKNKLPFFTLLKWELEKAKWEFFNEFYEEYKKQAGWEENMDPAILLQKDLNDMEDPEKRAQLIKKYNELFLESEIENNLAEWEKFGEEIVDLRQQVIDSLKPQETEQKTEQKTTKDVLEEEKLPGRKPTKRYEKIEEEKLDLPWETRESLRENPFRYILKDILKDFIEPLNKKWEAVDWDSKDIVKYKRKKNISRVEVQERIMEKWKEMAQQYMNKLKENQKKIFDFQKEFFDTDIDYDIKNFFTEFLKNTKVDNKLSELFKKGILSLEEVYDENWNLTLEVVYNWEQRIPSTEARETMELLNDIIKELQKYWKDDKLLLDEASLYELRKMMKEWWYNIKGKEKAWTFADRAQDLYAIFNDYLDTYKDTTWIWKDIRPYDHAFSDYFELVDLLDKFFNWEWEIKKESRNRLINIAEKAWEKLNLLDKLIPWTKEMLKLMESWHDFITKMVTFMEATNYKTWFGKRVLKYWPMMLTAIALKGFLPFWLSAILAIPVWETIWEKVRNLLWRKRPSIRDIEEIFKQLDLTEEEIQILKEKRPKEFEKTLSDLDAHFDEALKEIFWDYEKGRQKEEWPKAYDRQGNEVRRVNEDWTPVEPESKWWPDDTTPPTPPTPKWPKNPPKNDWGREMEKEISDIEDEWIMEELNLMESTSNQLENVIKDMVVSAETKKDAKLVLAAAWLKMTNAMLALRDSPRVKAAKKDAQRIMKMDKWYELLKSKIDKTEWEVQLVYVNALYKLMLAWKAPTSMISIDYDYVADKKNIKDSAAYSTEWQNIANWEMNKEIPTWFWYGEWYDSMIAEIVKKMIKAGKREVQDSWVTDSVYQFLKWWDQDAAWKQVIDDAYTAYDRVMEKDKTTTREQARNIKIKEAEWKRIEEEVWELMDPEDIKKREDLWFSFDKEVKSKNKTRRDNQWATIVNKDKVDYIDWWLTRWTIMISWWAKDWMTRVMVNNLETLSNFPQVEKSLPKNSIIIDSSTWKEYSLADIQRMDIKGETNTKTFEEYYKKQMEEYPEEVQDIFNEKDQVVSSPEWKSEPQETQAEQSYTEEEKTTKSEQEPEKKSKPKKISPEEEAHLFWEDKKTAEETNADSLVEAIKKYNWVDVAEFISHKWDKKGKTHIHLKDMTASDSRSFQEFVMNHKDLIEIYDDWWMGYVIKFKPWFKDNIKKYLK